MFRKLNHLVAPTAIEVYSIVMKIYNQFVIPLVSVMSTNQSYLVIKTTVDGNQNIKQT